MTGRRCYTIELDPRYCDVIINNYVKLTGNVGVTCERDGEVHQYVELKQENERTNAGTANGQQTSDREKNSSFPAINQ